MKHQPKTAALIALEEDLLSPKGKERLLRHLAGCDVCRAEQAAMRVYDGLVEDVKALPVPEVNWDKMDLALRREAREQAKIAKAEKSNSYAPLFGIAAAAALVAVAVSRFGAAGSGDTTVASTHVDPVSNHADSVVPDNDGDPIVGVVTAIAGGVHRDTETGPILAMGDSIAEGARLLSDSTAELHARMLEGTGFVLSGSSDVTITKARENAVEMTLAAGEVSSQVHHLAAEERFLVHAADYMVRVRGTRFSVKRTADDVAVSVDEGFVEVSKHGEVLAVVRAPGQWGSSGAISARASGQVPRARSLDAASLDLPVLNIPPLATMATWTVDGMTVPASGPFALRVSPGSLEVIGTDLHGVANRITYTVLAEGGTLDTARLFVPEAARPQAQRAGSLSAAAIQSVVQERRPALTRCYERWLRVRPDLSGATRLLVVVAPDGTVSDATFTMGSNTFAPLAQCVTSQVRTWAFPAPRGNGSVTFEIPFNFDRQTAPSP